jgi:cyclopropane fatty-acyl-phospholipid synthase-like methyltransferase
MSLPPLPAGDITDRIERAVIGAGFGADGYTTRAQADELARHLELRPGRLLLDLGSGQGWPALYLAARTGCDAVLTDLPLHGLAAARCRAERDELRHRCSILAAAGANLPFAAATFDAVSHADVLC